MSTTFDVRWGSQARRGERKRCRFTSTRLSTGDKAQRKRRGAEPIEMRERRHGYFPKAFVWHGQRYDVHAVERCWTISRRGRGGRVERHCFRVRCSFGSAVGEPAWPERSRRVEPQDRREGTFEVYQDVRHNTWHLQPFDLAQDKPFDLAQDKREMRR